MPSLQRKLRWLILNNMQSDEKTIGAYIKSLPPERAVAMSAIRNAISPHMPKGIVEVMNWGMISYELPLSIEPNTYNGKPLSFVGLGSQKNHMALYMNFIGCFPDGESKFVEQWKATGKKLDMGKSCLRFKKLEDLNIDLITATIAGASLEKYRQAAKRT